ncbi:histidine kinase [Fibrella aestuarina BUZ 2]|uniref:histidine kinase n=1 Tax=Fibrella aestuarina BUZ 2 TaxID=1166018 RepID=I0KFZ6_9BACT|nr:histidine kinase [Fibrella aestuarina]CCH03049.1 histidine kinase [Fibrella aestuarina BUZ 2]
MRVALAAFLVLVCCAPSVAQSANRLDSLRAVLTRLPAPGTSIRNDTARLQTLWELVLLEKNDTLADTYLQRTRQLIAAHRWTAAQPWQQLYQGILLFRKNYIYQAIDQCIDALKTGERTEAPMAFFARCHSQLGTCYFSLEEYRLAMMHYKKTLAIEQGNPRIATARDYVIVKNNIGLCYMNLAAYGKASSLFLEVIRDAHRRKDSLALAWTYSNLGSAERKASHWQRSIDYLERSIAYFGQRTPDNKAFAISEQALAYLGMGNNVKALELTNLAKQMTPAAQPFFGAYIADAAYRAEKANGLLGESIRDLERYDSLKLINDKILKKKSIDGLRYAYENEKKEAELTKERFRTTSLMVGVAAACLFLLYFVFNQRLLRRKNRKIAQQNEQIEQANTRLTAFNQELEGRVEERTRQLQAAYDEIKTAMTRGQTLERRRVASELHDNLGSMISGIRFQMQAIDTDVLHPAEQQVYQRVFELLGDAYHEVRNISHNLLPAVLETKGLYAALSNLVADLNVNKRMQFKLIADATPQFNKQTDIELYCILLELTTNLMKHSTATQVIIAFTNQTNEGTMIELHDNGQVYDFKGNGKGKGLSSVLSRAENIGATLHHYPADPVGNCVEIMVPVTT